MSEHPAMSDQEQLFFALLERLRSADECHDIEAKRASSVDTSLLETICSFANEPGMGGGYLLLGVIRDENQPFPDYRVVGVPDPDKIQSDLASQCADRFNIALRPRIWAVVLEGRTALLVEVPEAQPSEKPVYFKAKGLPRGAFRRIGGSDQTCTEDDVFLLYQGRGHKAYEDTPLDEATIDADLSDDAIQQYRLRRERINALAPEIAWNKEELLHALGAVSRQKDGTLVPTIGGLLCFGKESALRRIMPLVRVDYVRIPGKTWVENPDTRFETIEMRGALLELIPRVISIVLNDLPRSFSLEDGVHRKEFPLVPEVVIREAVVNALMHRNYRTKQAVQIIHYANRLEIRNPGCSLKPDDQLGEPGSVNRNEKIAAILHECNLAETKGSGIRVMQELMERANLSTPFFESNRDADTFVLTLLTHHFMNSADIAWLEFFKNFSLSPDDARALVFLKEFGAIDNGAYRNINKVDTLHASAALRRLRDSGILVQRGKSAATYYQGGLVFVDSLRKPDVSPNLRSMIESLGARVKPETSKDVIVALCRHSPYSKKEISILLHRSEVTIGDLLGELLREGRLRLLYPEVPNHPQQKYRALPFPGEAHD